MRTHPKFPALLVSILVMTLIFVIELIWESELEPVVATATTTYEAALAQVKRLEVSIALEEVTIVNLEDAKFDEGLIHAQ